MLFFILTILPDLFQLFSRKLRKIYCGQIGQGFLDPVVHGYVLEARTLFLDPVVHGYVLEARSAYFIYGKTGLSNFKFPILVLVEVI